MPNNQNRKLAAILFADIVGYTALMAKNEEAALSSLDKFKTELSTLVPTYTGEIINFYGDGCLAIFQSSVEAALCAEKLQNIFQEDPKVPVRMGIHVGDVVFRDDNVFGNAVNVASRLESISIPGAVLVSKNVRNQIKNIPELKVVPIGTYEFKNVEEAISIYALATGSLPIPEPHEIKGKIKVEVNVKVNYKDHTPSPYKWLFGIVLLLLTSFAGWFFYQQETMPTTPVSEKPSIVVLPFENLSPNKEKQFLTDATSDEIRTTLSSIQRLKVTSRTSSKFFEGKNVSLQEIRNRLGVDHVLNGSILTIGDQIKVSAELSNTLTDEVEWTYNSGNTPSNRIFEIQQELALAITKELKININEQEVFKTFKPYTENPELYIEILKTRSKSAYDTEGRGAVEKKLKDILQKNPNNVLAIRTLADIYLIKGLTDFPIDSVRLLALPLYLKAEQLDESGVLYGSFAFYKLWYEWDFKSAEEFGIKGSNINDEWSINLLIDLYQKIDELDKAWEQVKKMEDINPIHETIYSLKGRCYFLSGDMKEAEKYAKLLTEKKPKVRDGYVDLGRVYLHQNKNQKAIEVFESGTKNLNRRIPFLTGYLAIAYHRLNQMEKFNSIIRELEERYETGGTGSPAFFLGAVYCNIGQPDKGFEWLDKSFATNDIEMSWLKMDPVFRPVKDDPRYLDLLKRVGFP